MPLMESTFKFYLLMLKIYQLQCTEVVRDHTLCSEAIRNYKILQTCTVNNSRQISWYPAVPLQCLFHHSRRILSAK